MSRFIPHSYKPLRYSCLVSQIFFLCIFTHIMHTTDAPHEFTPIFDFIKISEGVVKLLEHGYFRPLDTWRTFWFFLRQTLSTYRMGLIQSALVKAMSGAVQKIFFIKFGCFLTFLHNFEVKGLPFFWWGASDSSTEICGRFWGFSPKKWQSVHFKVV